MSLDFQRQGRKAARFDVAAMAMLSIERGADPAASDDFGQVALDAAQLTDESVMGDGGTAPRPLNWRSRTLQLQPGNSVEAFYSLTVSTGCAHIGADTSDGLDDVSWLFA